MTMRTHQAILTLALCISTPAAAQQSPDLDEAVTLTRGDLLKLWSAILSNRLYSLVARQGKTADVLDSVDVVLADKQGRIHINVMMKTAAVSNMQSKPPGEQMRALQAFRQGFAQSFFDSASGESEGAFAGIEHYRSASSGSLTRYLRSRTLDHVVLNIGFRQDGTSWLYANVTAAETRFNPGAPPARPN